MKSKESELRLTKGGKAGAIKERAIEEFRRFVLLFLYLWVLFGLFILDKTVVSRQQGLNFLPHGFALINALVLAKVMDRKLRGGARREGAISPLVIPVHSTSFDAHPAVYDP